MKSILGYVIFLSCLEKSSTLRISIIGGGPSGLLASISFARKGHTVDLFEKRESHLESGEEYNLLLNNRGLSALDRFGVNYKSKSVHVDNIVIHDVQHPKTIEKTCNYVSISRNDLIDSIRETMSIYDINMVHGNVKNINIKKKQLSINEETFGYDILVGADGISSTVRSHMKDIKVKTRLGDTVFKTFQLPKSCVGICDNSIHKWKIGNSDIICSPSIIGTHSGVFVSSIYKSCDMNKFPHIFDNMDDKCRLKFTNMSSRRHKYIYCSHLGIDNTILIGDAGHGTCNSLNQGVNSALEDVVCLDRCIVNKYLDVDGIVSLYNSARVCDAHSMCDLSRMVTKGDLDETISTRIHGYIDRSDVSYSEISLFIKDLSK